MDDKLILGKAIALLYHEAKLKDLAISSIDTVRTVLQNVKTPENGLGVNGDREIIRGLKATLMEMCSYGSMYDYDRDELLRQIRINCNADERLYQTIEQSLKDYDESQQKRMITLMRKSIDHYFRDQQIGLALDKAQLDWRFNRDKIGDTTTFLMNLINQLEPLQMQSDFKDPAVVSEVDIGDDKSMTDAFAKVIENNNSDTLIKFAWPEINDMMQGGGRPGETWVLGGLQHNYKTSLSLSLFAQIAICNRPVLKDPNKKPLILRISFEDEVATNLQFLYTYLKYSETGVYVDINAVSVEEMRDYVKKIMGATGFHVKMMRVDPHGWTVKAILNKVIELESQGYEVKVLALDYLYKVPTTGCAIGPAGTDHMDALSRVRNFCSAKGIFHMNPHQLSTEAKTLLRTAGIAEANFVKEIQGKGYFEGTRGLDRIYDGAILFHKVRHNKKWYFTMQLDKHRFPSIAEDDKRYVIFEFPKGMPIPHNLEGRYTGMKSLPSTASNADESLFAF